MSGADAYAHHEPGTLSELEVPQRKWMVTLAEAKLLLVASTGFFIDAYDLFAINLIVPLVGFEYLGTLGGTLSRGAPLRGGLLKAAANIGCIIGQIFFGLMSDIFGRKAMYAKGLMVTIFATILLISVPNYFSPTGIFTWLTCWRILLGIGIGGDYPMSAAVVSDRANLHRRGLMLTFVFSMQGWGNFGASIVALILLAIFRSSIRDGGHYGHFDAVWRLLAGLILVPAFGTIVQRLLLPESTKFKNVQALRDDPTLLKKGLLPNDPPVARDEEDRSSSTSDQHTPTDPEKIHAIGKSDAPAAPPVKAVLAKKRGSWDEFIEYFSEWRHLKNLIGTAGCWFLVDITFYGINLNQSSVIAAIGYADSKEPWQYLWELTIANLIIVSAGFLPGYYLTMFTVEYIGRKWLQFGGFLFEALFLAIIAGTFERLRHQPAAFLVVFAFLQLSFNFGANATTFLYPAEVFPTRVRGFAHGFSAAMGKCGAVLAALGFAEWQADIGTANVLWIFFAVSILGALLTLILPETKGIDPDVLDMQERQAKAFLPSGEHRPVKV